MLSHNELKRGTRFVLDGQPYEVLESSLMFKGRGSSVNQVKVKNLRTGANLSKTLHPGEEFEEIEIDKIQIKFLYSHKEKFVFCRSENPSKRFELSKEVIGEGAKFLKPNTLVEGLEYQNEIINISIPIKVQLKVAEAPPGVKGDRAQGGTKVVVLETGAEINAPLFVETDDVIEINTETGQYSRRVE